MKEEKKVLIDARRINKTFKKGQLAVTVIEGMDLQIYEGDFTVIMGRSGSGKSTLLYCISAMDSLSAGEVFLEGRRISNLSERDIAFVRTNKLAFIFQSFNLFSDMTFFDNIAYVGYQSGRGKQAVNEKAEQLLGMLGISGERDKYPGETSGGQQQRAAIARALINDPQIIFGDEPTGALSLSAGENVLNILSELNAGNLTIILVTHDVNVATRATRLLYLTDGRLDGELLMERYEAASAAERKMKVINFLNERGW